MTPGAISPHEAELCHMALDFVMAACWFVAELAKVDSAQSSFYTKRQVSQVQDGSPRPVTPES